MPLCIRPFRGRGRTGKNGMTEDEPRQDPESPQDARLTSLDERLRQAQAEEAERAGGRRRPHADYGRPGMRVLSA